MITITGSGFGDHATVKFDGVAATHVVVVNQTTITCTPPDHADGFVEVVVTNPDGTTGSLADAFVYTTLAIDPEEGPVAGGTTLTVAIMDGGAGIDWFPSGHTFRVHITNANSTIDFSDPDLYVLLTGGVEGTRISDGEVTCETPEGVCGPTDVIVIDASKGWPDPNVAFYLPGGYTYQLNAPVVTDLLPISGAARGGTHVVLTGTFSPTTCSGGGTTVVTIGDVPLTSLGCTVDTITGITGVHEAGVVDVVVINPDGQTLTLPDAYTYVNAPTVTAIDPETGPDTGGTAVTVTGTGFQTGAGVTLRSLDVNNLVTEAVAFDVVVVNDTTITAMTSGHPAAIVDVVVTNPDEQWGMLERGYGYLGWWVFDPTAGSGSGFGAFEIPIAFNVNDDLNFPPLPPHIPPPGFVWPDDIGPLDPFSFTWRMYLPGIPGVGWTTEEELPIPVDGWWMSIAGYGGAVMVVASSRPKDPRRWDQIATFATASAAMLGGSPGIAGVFHNRLVYAASDYTVGTTYPPIRIYNGSYDRELCRLPPTSTNTIPVAILSLLVANGTIYLSTFDSGTSSTTWLGRVFSLDLNTAVLTPIGTTFPAGHLPYALAWHNGMLWCGTHRQATDVAGKIFRIRPGVDTAWTEDYTLTGLAGVAALLSWQGTLYAGTTAAAGTFAQILKRATDGSWSTADTGSGGGAQANNGYLAFCEFNNALYASYWNADAPAVARIRTTTDGVTWTTSYTGAAGTLRPFIVLYVDKGELFAIGGGAHLTAAIVVTANGTTWTDLTAELPDTDKTALPAVAALVF